MVANFAEIIQNQVLMSKKTLTLTAVATVIIIGAAFIFAAKSSKKGSGASALTSEQKYCNTVCVEGDSEEEIIRKAANVIPSENQFQALENEFIAFVHFGPNTFTGKEWGNGMETPEMFALKELDTDQWCQAMKDAGMKMVIFTAKHHDGFVMWQSRYTRHGIMSSGFRNGEGDVLSFF